MDHGRCRTDVEATPPSCLTIIASKGNACERMTYQNHPGVKFDFGLSGFCPIKVTVPGRWPFSSSKDYMSGFEMSLQRFDFERYFNLKRGGTESKKNELREEGFASERG
jgi:hypothetical protein